MCYEPLAGWRHLMVRARRTKAGWAWCIKELVEVHYPEAERLVLVMDNLNTHTPAALYEVFPPEQARGLAERLEIHYTPKHGSWLNMAEIELSVLARRIPDQATLTQEAAAWEETRNIQGRAVDWRFTTADARIRLKHLYPSIQE
jgi:DDE superfamily endonuclease